VSNVQFQYRILISGEQEGGEAEVLQPEHSTGTGAKGKSWSSMDAIKRKKL